MKCLYISRKLNIVINNLRDKEEFGCKETFSITHLKHERKSVIRIIFIYEINYYC